MITLEIFKKKFFWKEKVFDYEAVEHINKIINREANRFRSETKIYEGIVLDAYRRIYKSIPDDSISFLIVKNSIEEASLSFPDYEFLLIVEAKRKSFIKKGTSRDKFAELVYK